MTIRTRINGFTLIELIVCIGVIASLVGLTLSAVMKGRSSSRKVACSNNLRQVGTALHLFETSERRFPGVFCGVTAINAPSDQIVSFSPSSQIAPYLVGNSWNEAGRFGKTTAASDADWLKTEIASPSVLRCPEDVNAVGMATSYRYNRGNLPLWPEDPGGVFIRDDQGFRVSDILDGLSVTAFASERPVSNPSSGRFNPGVDLVELATDGNGVSGACWVANNRGFSSEDLVSPEPVGISWLSGRWIHASYYHFLPPNSRWFDCSGEATSILSLVNARSFHDGGVNVLFGDGSVRLRTAGVSLQVWRSEGTRSGGEADQDE